MFDNEIRYTVIVNESGRLLIQGEADMLNKLKSHIGEKGTLTISFQEKSVKGLAIHYENDLVPQFKQAHLELGEYLHESVIKKKLWYMSEVTKNTGHESPYSLKHHEAIFFIADLRRIAAEHYNFYLKTYTEL